MNKRLLIALSAAVFSLQVVAQTPCEEGFAGIYPCDNVDLWTHMTIDELGGADNLNDIWGWTDIASGREFAIVCKSNGTAFVDVTDPANPIYLGTLPTHTTASLWRDAKVFGNYVFIVSEAPQHGMQVFDLMELLQVTDTPVEFEESAHYDGHGRSHNIAINEESGYAYSVGTNTFNGGLHIIDINDPLNPVIAGDFGEDGYTHDVQVVNYEGPDDDYCGKEIAFACNENTLTIADVTDKSDCQLVATSPYDDSGYSHQGWLTEDQRYFLLGDELDELNGFTDQTRTFIWDVTDLDNPVLIDVYEGVATSIDHNLYTRWQMVFQSDYRSGLRILNASQAREGELSEIGFFDCQPNDDNAQFSGSWSNYAYFGSGTVVVTDMYTGLFIVKPRVASADGYVEINQGDDAANMNAYISYNAEISSIEFENLPAGVSADVPSYSLPGAIQINLSGLSSLSTGDYSFTIKVNYDGQVHNSNAEINVFDYTPPSISAMTPPDEELLNTSTVNLSWASNFAATSYFVELAEDETFESIVHSENTTLTELTIPFDLPNGVYYWRVSAEGDCDLMVDSDISSFEVLVISVEENDAAQMMVYPNPAHDVVTIKFNTPIGGTLSLVDEIGRNVMELNVTTQQISIPLTDLKPGVYTLQAIGMAPRKLIIQ